MQSWKQLELPLEERQQQHRHHYHRHHHQLLPRPLRQMVLTAPRLLRFRHQLYPLCPQTPLLLLSLWLPRQLFLLLLQQSYMVMRRWSRLLPP